MPEAAADTHHIRDARQRSSAWECVRGSWRASLVCLTLAMARPAAAQLPPSPLPLSNTEDARTLPKGTFLLRALNAWTRIDAVYDLAADSTLPLHALGDAFSIGELGVRQFPMLATAQNALRTLTGDASLSLNLGQTYSTVDTRIVTTPFTLQYGVTNRLTIGAMVPVVQTHSDVFVELNPRRLGTQTGANVGPNAARLGDPTALAASTALISSLTTAGASLLSYVNNCNSSGSCSPEALARANWALKNDTLYRNAAEYLYGGTQSASSFSPFGNAQTAVNAQLKALQDSVALVLGSSFTFIAPVTNGPAALQQLQQLATSPLGAAYDSIGSPDRIGIGDIEVSALFKLVDGFADTTGGLRLRGTLSGVLRLGTGRPPSGTVPYEVGTGTGQTSADGGAVLDMKFSRRFMATVAGTYTTYFTSATVPRLPNSDYSLFPFDVPVAGTWREGDAVQLMATPRYSVTDYFMLHGAYTFRHQAASRYTSPDGAPTPLFSATTEQRAGWGFAYSAVTRYARGRGTLPFEMSYTHLETVTASGGLTPKYHRDQIEFRIYYRLRR